VGILFVLHTGIAWRHLPAELGFGSGVTCWRRRSGLASRELHGLLLEWLRAVGQIEWRRGLVGPSPVDRGRLGSKLPDRRGRVRHQAAQPLSPLPRGAILGREPTALPIAARGR